MAYPLNMIIAACYVPVTSEKKSFSVKMMRFQGCDVLSGLLTFEKDSIRSQSSFISTVLMTIIIIIFVKIQFYFMFNPIVDEVCPLSLFILLFLLTEAW